LLLLDEPAALLNAGSVQIDEAFEEIVTERLRIIRPRQPQLAEHIGHRMAKSDFQVIKECFGTKKGDLILPARITVPGLPGDFNDRDAKIEDGNVVISRYVDRQ
jgi:hypothetical protein